MRKILVIGSGGAGKSTFAMQLGKYLRIKVVHLDALFWKPGWVESSPQEWQSTIDEVTTGDAWIVDGNYSSTLTARLQACDTVIFIDLPRIVCLWRVIKRTLQHYGKTRPDMANGCDERLDLAFLHWVWSFPSQGHQRVTALLDQHGMGKKIIHLRSRRQVRRFLAQASGCSCT